MLLHRGSYRSAATTVTLSLVPLRIASATTLLAIVCANSAPSAGAAGLSRLLPGFPTPRALNEPARPRDMTLLVLRGGAGLLPEPPDCGAVKLYEAEGAEGSFTPGTPCERRRETKTNNLRMPALIMGHSTQDECRVRSSCGARAGVGVLAGAPCAPAARGSCEGSRCTRRAPCQS